MSRIVVEQNLLKNNVNLIKEKLKESANEKVPIIIAVLKANAYGMGKVEFASFLLENGIDYFAVAEVEEAIELRNAGFTNNILVLNDTSIPDELDKIVEYDLMATIGSINTMNNLNVIASQKNKIVKCHLKIDTGFGRFGFRYDELIYHQDLVLTLKNAITEMKNIEVVGTYSHFQESYASDSRNTKKQFARFMNCINILKEAHIQTGLLHICNSAGFLQYKEMHLDAVRIGSAFTGRVPIRNDLGLKPIGYLESRICAIRRAKKGDKVGYSGICQLKKDTTVAVVEAGYSDGVEVTRWDDKVRLIDKLRILKTDFLRLLKDENRYVEINQKPCKILGRIGMNNFLVDITDSDIKIGDKVKIKIHLVYASSKIERVYV